MISQSGDIATHMRSHPGEKRFKCNVGKAFLCQATYFITEESTQEKDHMNIKIVTIFLNNYMFYLRTCFPIQERSHLNAQHTENASQGVII